VSSDTVDGIRWYLHFYNDVFRNVVAAVKTISRE
jgi:hypothetical protein